VKRFILGIAVASTFDECSIELGLCIYLCYKNDGLGNDASPVGCIFVSHSCLFLLNINTRTYCMNEFMIVRNTLNLVE
jgi:hypothetical protein